MFVRELRRERDYERPDWNSQVGNMIPAWMLADTFLALLVAGALGAVTLLPCAVHSTSEPTDVNSVTSRISACTTGFVESDQ